MGLRIVYGKSGSGKSKFIYDEIHKHINSEVCNKIYIITPEQFSFTAEKKLMELNHKIRLEGWKLEYINIQGIEGSKYTMFIGIEKESRLGQLFESHKFCKYKSKEKCENLKNDILKYLM